MSNLFEAAGIAGASTKPLAERLRPKSLSEVVGQDDLLGENAPLTRMLKNGRLASLIFWGPPGCGKTTIARLLAVETDLEFVSLSAVFSGVADLRKAFDDARSRRELGRGTLLFVDEIHRFNRSQQDAFLPVVEEGIVVLVGATTENPSFELNAALLSRCQVLVLSRLSDEALETLISKAEDVSKSPLPIDTSARKSLKELADGDGRYLLNLVEELIYLPSTPILDSADLSRVIQKRSPVYDKAQESHYNLISALHKSMRGSDPDAALYWLARMLSGGEDPKYIARRIARFAAEDIGLADPQALPLALAAWEHYERLGSPEGELALAEAVVYLALAPKSNAIYTAFNAAMQAAKANGSLMPPKHILNAPTKLLEELGYSEGYAYDHNQEEGFSGQNYFPDGMERAVFYKPVERGFEREAIKRLSYWAKLRDKREDKDK
ncbi:MAG: replication-associated recombination protein A [Rhodospirillales bacterium]